MNAVTINSGMLYRKQKISDEIKIQTQEFLEKGGKVKVSESPDFDYNYKPAKESISYAF